MTVAALPADLMDAEIAFFAEELRRMGAAAAALPEDDTEPGSRKDRPAGPANLPPCHWRGGQRHTPGAGRAASAAANPYRRPAARSAPDAQASARGADGALQGDGRAEHRRAPQRSGGAYPGSGGGKEFDLRVSCVAALHGETIVMRVLDRSSVLIGLDKLGLTPQDREQIESWTTQPNGLIVATGPTGTGKTTLLYSLLHQINDVGRKIVTVEDPVEYQLSGTVQIAVNKVGLTFPVALRAVLRQTPMF